MINGLLPRGHSVTSYLYVDFRYERRNQIFSSRGRVQSKLARGSTKLVDLSTKSYVDSNLEKTFETPYVGTKYI